MPIRRVSRQPKNEPLSLSNAPLGLGAALEQKGFEKFTPVQEAVLNAAQQGRDLRITSQTGSGKTVALGLAVAEEVAAAVEQEQPQKGPATPIAVFVAPTRELAAQLGREFQWLYKPLRARVLVVTGGTSVREEQRGLYRQPHVVVGTPGRLVDHLRSKSLNLDSLRILALDEADEMLALNFEEELNTIVDATPSDRITHLVSATFPRAVARLADRFQKDPVTIAGTVLGKSNTDIEHFVVRVYAADRYNAAVNLLLRYPDDKTLVFVRTRIDTVTLAEHLTAAGLHAQALNGEMTQRERSATFAAFRGDSLRFLVATDVAARGLDVQDIARVIQVDLPENEEVFTHRSGRTGRAGRKGNNVLFVPPHGERRAKSILRAAEVSAVEIDVPTLEELRQATEERLCEGFVEASQNEKSPHKRWLQLAERLLGSEDQKKRLLGFWTKGSLLRCGVRVICDRFVRRHRVAAATGAMKAVVVKTERRAMVAPTETPITQRFRSVGAKTMARTKVALWPSFVGAAKSTAVKWG
ncbi:MAG: DEAD/DEAH box helicase [Polyangiales bacterium]